MILFVYDEKTGKDYKKTILEVAKNKKIIEVCNKSDLVPIKKRGVIYSSAIHEDVDMVKQAIYDSLNLNEEAFASPSLSNERELALLRRMNGELDLAIASCVRGDSVDLVSAFIQEAYRLLQELLGEELSYDLTDEIFSRFCVGK